MTPVDRLCRLGQSPVVLPAWMQDFTIPQS